MSCVIRWMNMQQQTQGQPPGVQGLQTGLQAQQAGQQASASSTVQRFQAWHTESGDLTDRRIIVEQIMQLFHRKRKSSASDWNQRMPDFVRRLEERLYREAKTKEEYMDLSTLEQRLQAVAQKMQMMNNRVGLAAVRNVNMIPAARSAASSMIPTPGATTMIPTPGLTSAAAKTNLQCPVPPPQRTMQVPVSSSQAHSNGHFVNGGLTGSPFIGNQHSLMGSSGMYYPQGSVPRDCFHQPRSTILNGDSSMVQSSKMIPVPGLPPHMVQQLQSENSQASNISTTQPPRRQAPARPQNHSNHQKRPLDTGQLPKCQTSSSVADAAGAFDPVKAENQRRRSSLLIHVLHSMRCPTGEGQCSVFPQCFKTRLLFRHAKTCREERCQHYPACPTIRALLRHFTQCQAEDCAICVPARRQGFLRSGSSSPVTSTNFPASAPSSEESFPATKKQRLEANSQVKAEPETVASVSGKGKSQVSSSLTAEEGSGSKLAVQPKAELSPVKVEAQEGAMEGHSSSTEVLKRPVRKQKASAISLMELFTAEQIRHHIQSLRLWIGQSKAKAEKNQSIPVSEGACRLCQVERLTFEPPPLYCTICGGRIKRNLSYYTGTPMETRYYFCVPCYNDVRGENIEIEGHSYPKTRLEKKKNDEETEEAWVQCDKCNIWLHQICTLFNGRRNEGGETEFVCPFCLMADLDSGGKPLPPNSVLGAKDLPRTLLSDHLEQRLSRKLQQERAERARLEGKSPEEVPGAEGLVIRVVSSVDKKLEVKQRFMEIFKDTEYPTDYNYKSKALLLFQNIEGVEVCLFSLYVQEFGSDCLQPNNRRLYIAYLDSVKYFRPEVKTIHGEALRTFVYHEILIGYLEYAKKRGFGSCYIWACPPLRGEDYILYCHPEIQKTPRNEKLREWYLAMLNKAMKEEVVVELTNFYDYFFVSPEECKANVTAARLPYFDGDYWPGAAEEMLLQIQQEEEEKRKVQRRVPCKKGVAKRVGIGVQAEMASNASRDLQLVHKLRVVIEPMKGDFIMVHMHYSCRHCRQFITSGSRWICKQCNNFYLCNRCYLADQKLDERDRHPWNSREFHQFYSVETAEIPADTTDKDDIMESEFFDTRQSFLSLCQGNHYQYDTLRRAKHSSMMILYHLHNPTEPAFVTTCNICHLDIDPGQGWRCSTCPDYDLCATCYSKDTTKHPHPLTRQLSVAERNAQNKEARQQRVEQLRRMLELLSHASQCCASNCSYPKCRNVKNLFRHGTVCRTRASGGCRMCKTMWHLLQLHARACKESDCRVPRCKDLKEHIRRSQLQSESRRRAAVNEMVRQRAADFASATS